MALERDTASWFVLRWFARKGGGGGGGRVNWFNGAYFGDSLEGSLMVF